METVTISHFGKSYRINNPGEGRIGSKLNMGEPYEKKLLIDIYQHNLRGTAFDVGAHIGNHSLYLAAICGLKVIAWEPHKESRLQLLHNLALNPTLNIDVLDWAAGDKATHGRFTSGMWLEFDPTRDGDKLKLNRGEVEVFPIDDMIDIPSVSVVKVDVEGMEPQVLAGMTRHLARSRPLVYAETHTKAAQKATAKVLEPLGYTLSRVLHMGSPMHRWEA